MQLSEQKLNRIIKIMVIITLALASIYIFSQFSGFINSVKGAITAVLVPFIIAFFINFLIFPLVVAAEDKGIRPRWLIVTLIYIIIFGVLGLVLYKIIPMITKELTSLLIDKVPNMIEDLTLRIESLNLQENKVLQAIYVQTQTGINNYFVTQGTSVTTAIPSIMSGVFTIVLTPIILFYFLKDHNKIGEGLYRVVPNKYKEHFVELVKRVNETLGLYIRGQVIIMFAIGVFSTLIYMLIGLEYAIVFGVIVGLTNIIPYIGATLAAIVPVTYALLAGGNVEWYYVLLANIGFQFVEGNILQPVIMSKQLDMHPLIILAAILGFGSLFGVIGIIFAVPIAGLIKVCIIYYYEINEKNKNKGYEV